MDDFKWFLGFLIVLVVVWFSGKTAFNTRPISPNTSRGTQTTQTKTPAPAKTTPVQSPADQLKEAELQLKRLQEEVRQAEAEKSFSALRGKLKIVSAVRGTTAAREYVLIQAPSTNKEAVLIVVPTEQVHRFFGSGKSVCASPSSRVPDSFEGTAPDRRI
jgi:hypothetical protein